MAERDSFSTISEHGRHYHHSQRNRPQDDLASGVPSETVEMPLGERDRPMSYTVVSMPPSEAYVVGYAYDGNGNPGAVPNPQQDWSCVAFAQRSRRMAFVRKVLGIVGLQLGFCAFLTALLLFASENANKWAAEHWWMGVVGGLVFIVISIAVGCCHVGRGPPNVFNVSLLVLATIGLSVLCAFITTKYQDRVEVILYALSTTVAILLVLILITAFTKIDITGWAIYLCIAGLFLVIGAFVVSLLFAFGQIDKETRSIVSLVISFLVALLLCFYILWDLQVIMGGGRKFQLEECDWLFACLELFGDIVNLFLTLLEIFGYFSKK